jgi:phosphatidylglycerol:prolipoprotein diacylglycerol transferase
MYPQLFQIGGVTIYSFGAMVCISFLSAFAIARFLIRRDTVDPLYPPDAPEEVKKKALDYVYDLGFCAMVAGVLGARLFHIAAPDNIAHYGAHPKEIFKVWEGGLVFYGGFIAAFASCYLMTVRKGIAPWQLGDFVAAPAAFAHAIARIGCFMNGCCYGTPCEGGVTFPNLPEHLRVPRHPTQLYEAGENLLIGLILVWMLPRRRFRGQVWFSLILLYGIARFAVEFVRDDPRGGIGGLATSQWIGLGAIPFALAGLFIQRKRQPIAKAGL